MPDSPIVYLLLAGLVSAFGAWAGWNFGGRRKRKKQRVLPDLVWLCPSCSSFNDPPHEACYHCRRRRPADAQFVVPDAEFHIEQRFGPTNGDGDRGASKPWLGAEEPLRDASLAGHPIQEPDPDEAETSGSADATEPVDRPTPRA